MNKQKRPLERKHAPPKHTPCGYCFSRWATGWDHLIPYAFRPDDSQSNLYPSCKRCNSISGALVFDSIEEKREYVQARLEKREPAVCILLNTINKTKAPPAILQPEMPVASVVQQESSGGTESQSVRRYGPKMLREIRRMRREIAAEEAKEKSIAAIDRLAKKTKLAWLKK
jgi:uncharacterized membrane protein